MAKINIRIPDLERHFSSDVFKDYQERLWALRKKACSQLESDPLDRILKSQGKVEMIDQVLRLPDEMIKEYRTRDDKLSITNT